MSNIATARTLLIFAIIAFGPLLLGREPSITLGLASLALFGCALGSSIYYSDYGSVITPSIVAYLVSATSFVAFNTGGVESAPDWYAVIRDLNAMVSVILTIPIAAYSAYVTTNPSERKRVSITI